MQGIPQVALSRWWSTRGVFATRLRETEEEALQVCVRKWGSLVVHVFDRGYASAAWLGVLGRYRCRLVIRWIHSHIFLTLSGEEKKLWQIGQGKKYLAHKMIRESHTGEQMACDLWWCPVRHREYATPLWLVKARVKKGMMYLITNEPVHTEADAWAIFFTYRRRWQIELCFRSSLGRSFLSITGSSKIGDDSYAVVSS
jgi:hypothetical protein